MRFRIELVIANEVGQEQQRIVALEKSCNPGDVSRCGLGLTVADSKSLPGTVQQNLIKTEVQAMSVAHADCPHCLAPMKRKDVRPIEYRTLFGKYTPDSERLFTCCCQEQEKKSFSPLNDAIVTHTHPELIFSGTLGITDILSTIIVLAERGISHRRCDQFKQHEDQGSPDWAAH